MRKILLIAALGIGLASCSSESPDFLEGRVLDYAYTQGATHPQVTIDVFNDGIYKVDASESAYADITVEDVAKPLYVRMRKNERGVYDLEEKAKLQHQNRRPVRYTFPSDNKVVAEVVPKKQ